MLPNAAIGRDQSSPTMHVFAIGDCEFFLFSPENDEGRDQSVTTWKVKETFPYTYPAEFGSRPLTLVSAPRTD